MFGQLEIIIVANTCTNFFDKENFFSYLNYIDLFKYKFIDLITIMCFLLFFFFFK